MTNRISLRLPKVFAAPPEEGSAVWLALEERHLLLRRGAHRLGGELGWTGKGRRHHF